MSAPVTIVLGVEGASAISSAIEGVALRLASLAGVVATLNKAISGFTSVVELGRRLEELHLRTGDSVGNIVIFQKALKTATGSADNLAQFVGILQRSLAGMNDDGTSTAVVFQQLGLSMGRLRQMPSVEAVEMIGQALQKLPTQADRAAAAMKLFGRGGTELLPLLLKGGIFEQARASASGFGSVMERSAETFARLNITLNSFKGKLTEAYAIIAEKLAPSVQKVADILKTVSVDTLANGIQRAVEVGLLVGGTAGFAKLIGKANFMFLDWATKPGAAVANSIGGALTGFTGALAKILPWGLAAALAAEIGLGIYQASKDAENRRGEMVAKAQEQNRDEVQKLTKIRSQAEAEALAKENAAKLAALETEKKKLLELANQDVLIRRDREGFEYHRKRGLSDDEQAQLKATETRLDGARRFNALIGDRAKIEQTIATNTAADREAEAKQQASIKAKKELFDLETQIVAAQTRRDQPEVDRIQRLLDQKKLQEELRDIEEKGVSTAGLVDSRLKARDGAIEKQRNDLRAAFDLGTRQQQAELQANLAEQNRLTLLANEKKYREELLQLGAAAEPLVQARLKTDKETLDRQAAQVVLQSQLTAANSALEQVQQSRSLITQSQLLDESTKRQRLTANTEEYRKALAAVVELKIKERGLAVGAADQAKIDAEIAALRAGGASYGVGDTPPTKFQATKNQFSDRNSPYQSYQGAGEGVAGGAMEFMNGVGSSANAAAAAVNGGLNSALQGTTSALSGLFRGALTFKGAWNTAISAVRDSFLNMAAEWVAKEIWRFTIGAALKKAEVALHIGAEGAKTGATAAGATARGGIHIGETIFHGIQVVIRTTAHIAGEIAKTTVTLIQSGIRITATVLEAGKELILAGIKAMSAVASIPYVGPFLAVAALAAILAVGANAMKKRATGGPVSRGEPYVVGDGGRPEVFVPTENGQIVPSLEAFAGLSGMAANNLAARGAALASANADAQTAKATAGKTGGAATGPDGRPLTVAVLDPRSDRSTIEDLERDPRADVWFVNKLNKHRRTIPGVRV